MNRLAGKLREDESRLFRRLMRDPESVIAEHDLPAEKAYLARMYRLNRRLRERTTGSGSSTRDPLVERWNREVISDARQWSLGERDLSDLLDLCWGIDGESGALHHRYEREERYGQDISWYERPEAATEIRAFAAAVVGELDRRAPDATDRERLFIEVESHETRLIATARMRYRPVD